MIFVALFLAVAVSGQNSAYYSNQGENFLKKGQYYKAVISFKTALNKSPANEKAILGLAASYLYTGGFQEAYKLYYRRIQLNPNDVVSLTGAGSAQAAMGNYNSALKYYQQAVKISNDNPDAHYGIAEIYYMKKKNLWAERKIETILRMNPFHYQTLILQARIKSDIGRHDEAVSIIKKAIDSNQLMPDAYLYYSRFLVKRYFNEGDSAYLNDAIEEAMRAVSIAPELYDGFKLLGDIYYLIDKYEEALQNYNKAVNLRNNDSALSYRFGLVYDMKGDTVKAREYYTKAFNENRANNYLQVKLENYLANNDVSFGNPIRVDLSEKYSDLANAMVDASLVDRSIYFLRRSIYMNPLNKQTRIEFMKYMKTYGYDRFYIDELKKIYKLFPEDEIRQMLDVALIKRRDEFYFNEGFGTDLPERNVPNVLVVDLVAENKIPAFPEAGGVLADCITFGLNQYGRMNGVDVKRRNQIFKNIHSDLFTVNDYLMFLGEKHKYLSENIDFLVYGTCDVTTASAEITINIMNYKTGVVIKQFKISENENNYIHKISFKAANIIYDSIPFSGKIIKKNRDYVVINIGAFDGLKAGDTVYSETSKKSVLSKYPVPKKIVFKIKEVNTIVSKAIPLNSEDMAKTRKGMKIKPLKKRRASMVE